jgi:hypothetical protein
MALAILAVQTVVAAASTDAWAALKRGGPQLLGSGNSKRSGSWTRRAGCTPCRDGQGQGQLGGCVAARLLSLLAAQPDSAAELLTWVEQAQAGLSTAA